MITFGKLMPVTLAVASSIAMAACSVPTEEPETTVSELGNHDNDNDKDKRCAGGPNAVTKWNLIAASTLVAFPPAAGGAAPALQIHLGMVQGAVYDAVNAIAPRHQRHQPYLLETRFSTRASGEAAVAQAAYRVLVNIISNVPAMTADGTPIDFPNRGTLLQTLAAQYAASLAAIHESSSKRRGIDAGNAAADAMIAARTGDGRFGPSQWVPNPNAGHWNPVAPNGATVQDPTPWAGGVKPFLIQSSSQFRSPGPNRLTSTDYAADFNEVKALGGEGTVDLNSDGVVTPSARTETQTFIARFWQSPVPLMWSGVARDLLEAESGLDLADSARLLAMMNLSGADAAINCWNDKYHFDFWRPFQAIRRAGEDGNDATLPDLSWTPLLSAPYPDHTSGHMCLDGAHLRVLQMFFGTDVMHFGVTSTLFGGVTRTFDRFSAPLDEIVQARIWAGLHFRTANVQGRDIGINVANYMADNYFQKVGHHWVSN